MRSHLVASLLALAVLASPSPAHAAWPISTYTNLPVCTATGLQIQVEAVSDGNGGAILVWADQRSGTYDLYAQHILVSGITDPAWGANGVPVCTAADVQAYAQAISDGAGGAIVVWDDRRSGTADLYAQHLRADGSLDPAWPATGLAVTTAANAQSSPQLVADGMGGAIVAWTDFRGGVSYDIYAHHVLATGVVDPAWPVNGRALCTVTGDQVDPQLVTDGNGGAIVTWRDSRTGVYDIYAHHVLGTGGLDPLWMATGLPLCTANYAQDIARPLADGAGGVIVAWEDLRSGVSADIYAQRVLITGTVATGWPVNGRALCTASGHQYDPHVITDGAGGAIVAWYDSRTGKGDIYAHHVLPTGSVDTGGWPVDGRAVCAADSNQWYPELVPDGMGGAIVAWTDYRGDSDIYAMHLFSSGYLDAGWLSGGVAVSTAAGVQSSMQVVADDNDGILIAWEDSRNGGYDIFAQRMGRHGYIGTPEPEIVSVEDVPNDQGGAMKLSWNASWLDVQAYSSFDFYDVFRSLPPNAATARIAAGTRVAPLAAASAARIAGDLLTTVAAGQTWYWEFLATIPAHHFLAGYSYVVPTLGDSVAGSNPLTACLVVGHNDSYSMTWKSWPMGGYSVDDLAPLAPAPLTGTFAAGTTYLHWNPNAETDLAGYRLYRGSTAGFVPGAGNLVAALPDTGYADAYGIVSFYKLTAVDVHGNESPVAMLAPAGTVDTGQPAAPAELAFAAPAPNPARAAVALRFALPRAATVRLAIYDPAGRKVCELASGTRAAGEHVERWDLRDAGGRAASAGLYFARLEVDGRTLMRRIAITR